jgi:AcrR family transcriptional regulator
VSNHSAETLMRKPRQSRAKFTRESLIDAATQVLKDQGYDAFNTNRVAERAGVSIGSLYQYFPHKQALIEAIVVRHITLLASTIAAGLAQARSLPIGDAMDLLVQATIDVYASDLDLHRVVHEQIPQQQAEAAVSGTLGQLIAWLTELLTAHRDEMRPMDHAMAANMVVHLIKDTTCRITLGTLGAASMQSAKQELCLMVRTYLGVR